MKRFASANRVLYINPFSSDLLGRGGNDKSIHKGLWGRIGRKFRSMLKWLRHPEKNLYVFSPLFIPIQGRRWCDVINNVLLRLQLWPIYTILMTRKKILWMENIRAADLIGDVKAQCVVYHVSDLFAKDSYSCGSDIRHSRERLVTELSDVIICVSRRLYEDKQSENVNCLYLPHGVDFFRFRKAEENRCRYERIQDIPKPIAGYFGTMTAHNDIDLLFHCASNLPNVSFVLAGQITGGDYSELAKLPNVHLLGKIPYEQIPDLCADFDVCMLQWKMSDWIRSCNPLKLFEYMASGKPIVSVDIEEVRQYRDIVSIAASPEEFRQALLWELQHDTPQRREKRIDTAKDHDWERHVEIISDWIQKHIDTTSKPGKE
jgi:glycosyltransferase involved in cell wall biosynthesis